MMTKAGLSLVVPLCWTDATAYIYPNSFGNGLVSIVLGF